MGKLNIYKCLNCDVLVEKINSKKYCSIKCQQNYQWENIWKPRVIAGTAADKLCKRYLLESSPTCKCCGLGETWNHKKLVLQLNHIDGDSDNNKIDNLELLCPNCHTQTPTYGHGGQGNRYKKLSKRNVYLQNYKKNGSLA